MAANHFIKPSLPIRKVIPARLGQGSSDKYSDLESGKIVKLTAESRYELAVAGDSIEGFIDQVEAATSGGYSIGGVALTPYHVYATADGLQATPGTGVIAIGDYVVAGSITAKGTALAAFPKVCKATSQTWGKFTYRVVSLGTAGTGAVGTQLTLESI